MKNLSKAQESSLNPVGNYMFKGNNRNTRTRYEYFTPCCSVSIVNFEQVNAGWERSFGNQVENEARTRKS